MTIWLMSLIGLCLAAAAACYIYIKVQDYHYFEAKPSQQRVHVRRARRAYHALGAILLVASIAFLALLTFVAYDLGTPTQKKWEEKHL